MNESLYNLSDRQACLNHLICLNYLLAGDLESSEALETLMCRAKTIDWDSSSFVQLSEDMRVGMPKFIPDAEGKLFPFLLAALHFQRERLTEQEEAISIATSFLKSMIKNRDDAVKLLRAVVELNLKMRDCLETLGADTSPYTLLKEILP